MPRDVVAADRERLARCVTAARQRLRLSVRAAAKAAGVDRATWTGLEEGTRTTRDEKYAGIERALNWEIGTVQAILDGQEDPPGLPETDARQTVTPPAPTNYYSPAGYLAAILDELAEEWSDEVLHEAWRLRESKMDGTEQP